MGFVKHGDAEKINTLYEPKLDTDDEETSKKLEEVKKETKTSEKAGNNSELDKNKLN
jgi:hypothetical protein